MALLDIKVHWFKIMDNGHVRKPNRGTDLLTIFQESQLLGNRSLQPETLLEILVKLITSLPYIYSLIHLKVTIHQRPPTL